ncbi:MAG TPA: hypothetical protein VGE37_06300, partial [Archangium sp.]
VCHHPLCPDCAAVRWVPPISLLACGRCGELAEPLVRLKGEGTSLAQRLPGAFGFPFTVEGFAAMLGIALWLWLTSLGGIMGGLVGWSVAIASFFGLTRSSSRGSDHLELSDFQDPLTSVLMPVARFALVLFPAGVGLYLWARTGHGAFALVMFPAWVGLYLWARTGHVGFGIGSLVVCALWSPTAFIGAAAGTSVLHLMNPVRVLGVTARIGTDFGVYLGAVFGVGVLMLISVPLSLLVDKYVFVPVLGGVTSKLVLVYAPFVGARIAGFVLMLHGQAFGWGEELDRYEAVLGDTQPRGELPVRESTLPKHLPRHIELEPEPVFHDGPTDFKKSGTVDRFAALELSPEGDAPMGAAPLDVTLLPSLGEQNAATIRDAIQRNDADLALDGFRSTGLTSAPSLSFDELVWLGQTAASRIDFESAELAFRSAAERTAPDESLGRARVMYARLLAERLSRKDDATSWMKRIVEEHPGTSAAQYAQQWLETAAH